MRKLLSVMVIALVSAVNVPFSNTVVAAPISMEVGALPPRVVNKLLKAAADYWNLTLGSAYQKYQIGSIELMPSPEHGPDFYMVTYDGGCILVQMEEI